MFQKWGAILRGHPGAETFRRLISTVRPTRCTISQIYFWTALYMFRTLSPSIIGSLRCTYSIRYMSYWFVHLFGLTIEIHHDARSYKRQIFRRLIFVINCILFFGLYINYKNMHSINNIQCFAQFTVFIRMNDSVHLTFRKYLH